MATVYIPDPVLKVDAHYPRDGYGFTLYLADRELYYKHYSNEDCFSDYDIAESKFYDLIAAKFSKLLED